jgi:hypothetical protein
LLSKKAAATVHVCQVAQLNCSALRLYNLAKLKLCCEILQAVLKEKEQELQRLKAAGEAPLSPHKTGVTRSAVTSPKAVSSPETQHEDDEAVAATATSETVDSVTDDEVTALVNTSVNDATVITTTGNSSSQQSATAEAAVQKADVTPSLQLQIERLQSDCADLESRFKAAITQSTEDAVALRKEKRISSECTLPLLYSYLITVTTCCFIIQLLC